MGKFKFRLPLEIELTRQQRRAIDSTKSIFLTGVPGSGKTVVSVYRLKKYKNGILFTYGKLLRLAIQNLINNKIVENVHNWNWNIDDNKEYKEYLENRISDNNLLESINFFKQRCDYEYILVDEGQDLESNVYKLLKELTPNLSVSADNAQKVYSKGASEDDILKELPNNIKRIELDQNFRNSFEIYNFAKEFVQNNPRANDNHMLEKFIKGEANKPYVYLVEILDRTFEIIKKIISNNKGLNIGILSEDTLTVDTYKKLLSKDFDISSYTNKDKNVPQDLKNILVTTFKSSKGMEFDIVIMPQFQYLKEEKLNEYYVGATRAKTELYILAIGKLPPIFENICKSTYILKNEL